MSPGLNVIALISGGKDSMYSLVHCIGNGHRIVALGNLFPGGTSINEGSEYEQQTEEKDDNDDIDSFMYQTIGHGVIPLYESALGIPLYRQPILGRAIDMGRTYGDTTANITTTTTTTTTTQDETESLIPLLTRIKKAHPEANAISAGAILSTYQRTRIENVAARMGLVPLAWLWMYPFLPPTVERKMLYGGDYDVNDAGLLEDMAACGCEARIIKVASGGLDSGFLWEDVSSSTDSRVRRKLVRMMRRFVVGDIGGDDVRATVLGEGGEYETLAVDGPGILWKKKIEIGDHQREERVGDGGVGYLRFKGAKTVDKVVDDDDHHRDMNGSPETLVRRPFLLDDRFETLLAGLSYKDYVGGKMEDAARTLCATTTQFPSNWRIDPTQLANTGIWTISNLSAPEAGPGAGDQMREIVHKVEDILKMKKRDRSTDDIVFATVLLRSMSDFTLVNGVYVSLFKKPNPPARVAVGCGDDLPDGVAVMVSFVLDTGCRDRRQGLHVQSRSYWAPANIGPYSQAISIPIPIPLPLQNTSTPTSAPPDTSGRLVYIAGQIPLEPASMELVQTEKGQQQQQQKLWFDRYSIRAVLSLQHLWRIGTVMQVDWWVGAVAFLAGEHENMETKARIAWDLWGKIHHQDGNGDGDDDGAENEDEDEPALDAWDVKYGRRAEEVVTKTKHKEPGPPNWDILQSRSDASSLSSSEETPPFFAVQLAQLPRESDIEWQGLGIRCKSIKREIPASPLFTTRIQAMNEDEKTTTTTTTTFTGIEVDMNHSGPGFDTCIRDILAREVGATGVLLSQAVLYTTQPLLSDREGESDSGIWPGQIIPCKSVWGVNGRRLVAGVFLQMSSQQQRKQ